MDDFNQNPINSLLLLWLLYAVGTLVGIVVTIFLIGFPALGLKWLIEWIKRGQQIARARRESAPE